MAANASHIVVNLENCLQSVEHVSKLFLLFIGEGSKESFHFSRFEIWNFEDVVQQQLRVDQSGPGEQMDQPKIKLKQNTLI